MLWHLAFVALMSVCALQLAPCTSTAAQTLIKTYQHLRTVLRRLVLYLVFVTNKTRSVERSKALFGGGSFQSPAQPSFIFWTTTLG